MIAGETYRISVLTEGLLRLEYNEKGIFEDRATQVVVNREFDPVAFQVERDPERHLLTVTTSRLRLSYDERAFSSQGLSVEVTGDSKFPCRSYGVWHYGEEPRTLGGTARTLDGVDGACALGAGVLSRQGYAVLDDSRSLAVREDGWVEARQYPGMDLYFWGYGHDYLACLADFYRLCGRTPLLPRFVFGNWWSRFYAYTETSYMALIERFLAQKLPFSVAVIDMDWHLVDIDPRYGSGWTGYTWNRDLFPDPPRFLRWLHERGMKVTLNVHPADGIRAYEERYADMARALGMDPDRKDPIPFDIGSRAFLDAYFRQLHHPMEQEGVDFWWIDWQQGNTSAVEGLDPLWMLNHYHFLDSGRDGKRPLTFSRYAGPGSHRYPIGFSGDSVISWKSLAFQPYFTATASNIGYGWWSHDIGGHFFSDDSDPALKDHPGELLVRWLQLGVFSPICRLHSCKGLAYHKEPWYYEGEERRTMETFLRLRHRLIPYLYTMNARSSFRSIPLICPMYYTHPECEEAYHVPNQYWFGSELLAAPITEPVDPVTGMAAVEVWLPEGRYVDFFTGECFRGGSRVLISRDISSIPVLAKAGAVIVLADEANMETEPEMVNRTGNPECLTLRVYGEADGHFELYEDDGETTAYKNGACAVTRFVWSWENRLLRILPVCGEQSLVPKRRDYRIEYVCGFEEGGIAQIRRLRLNGVRCEDGAEIYLK